MTMATAIDARREARKTLSLRVEKLKNLIDMTELNLDGHPLTGIFGPNRCGKSTVLHALACCYQPITGYDSIDYKFRDFFIPNTHDLWSGSRLAVTHTYFYGGAEYTRDLEFFKKTSRWAPRYDLRPQRYVSFAGIQTCVPDLEKETQKTRIQYNTVARTDTLSRQVRHAASGALNCKYILLNQGYLLPAWSRL